MQALKVNPLHVIKFSIKYKSSQGHYKKQGNLKQVTRPPFTCSKLTIELLAQGVEYIQS